MIYNSILELIGNTPLVRLQTIEKDHNLDFKLYAKIEKFNASGSIKDRAALFMIKEALKNNLIKEDTVLIEPTSGNTGISLALICSLLNIKLEIVMPENFSKERIKMIRAYGAEIILTSKTLGMQGSVEYAKKKVEENSNYLMLSQFENFDNVKAHIDTTGPEIYNDLKDDLAMVIGCIGTGGTISGLANYFATKNVDVIGIEPLSSPLINKGFAAPHLIQGIGANFIPKILDLTNIKEVLMVSNESSYKACNELATKEGIFAGISSGASLAGLLENHQKYNLTNKSVVIILPDNGERYLSVEGLYE